MRYAQRAVDSPPDTSAETSPANDWYEEALAAGGIALFRWHPGGGRWTFSAQVEDLLGLAPGAFDGTLEGYLAHVEREDAPALEAALSELAAPSGAPRHVHRHRVRSGGGEVRWIELRAQVARDGEERATRVLGTLHDIGRVVGLERASSTREAQVGAFVDAIPGLALVIDEDGRYLEVFGPDEHLLAHSRDALVGQTMHEVLPETAASFFLEVVRDAIGTGQARSLDYPLTTSSGVETFFEARVAPVRGGWDGRRAVMWIANDITERRRTEHALRASEERYRTVVELLAEGVLVVGSDGTILASNPSADRILGFTSRDLSGNSTFSLGGWVVKDRHGACVAAEDFPVARALRGEQCGAELLAVRSPDDALVRWLEVSARPLEFAGRRGAALVSLVDVTEERRAHDALAESERQLRSVIESAEVTLWRFDTEGRVLFAGGRLLSKLGLTPEHVAGSSVLEDGSALLRADVQRALLGEEVRGEREWNGVTLDIVHAPVRGPSGAVAGLISVGVDVSERTRASRERERFVSELEAKNAELEQFNYTVSHDLKSPLITIQGFVDLLRKDLDAQRPERVARDLEHIAKATARMQRLLDDLLDLSRAGRMLRPERARLAELVDEALAQVEGAVSGRGVSIKVEEGLPEIHADRTRVLQLLQNLIDNAVKHLGEQRAPQISIGVRGDGVIYVRDNGRGVAERFHDTIFGLFERIDPSVPGTGVGLALARRIVEAHGGKIWVESEGIAGEGSAFCFTLPRAVPP